MFHFNWGNPEIKTNGWAMVAQAICGWNNNGTVGTISAYVAYWAAVSGTIVLMKRKEGRLGRAPWQRPNGKGRAPRLSTSSTDDAE